MGFKLLVWTDYGSGDSFRNVMFLRSRPRAALVYAYVEKDGRRDAIN
jgi:hypothetical protein